MGPRFWEVLKIYLRALGELSRSCEGHTKPQVTVVLSYLSYTVFLLDVKRREKEKSNKTLLT